MEPRKTTAATVATRLLKEKSSEAQSFRVNVFLPYHHTPIELPLNKEELEKKLNQEGCISIEISELPNFEFILSEDMYHKQLKLSSEQTCIDIKPNQIVIVAPEFQSVISNSKDSPLSSPTINESKLSHSNYVPKLFRHHSAPASISLEKMRDMRVIDLKKIRIIAQHAEHKEVNVRYVVRKRCIS